MKVLVFTGPESTGKSWLAQAVQKRFGGLLVSEYVRHFIDTHRRDTGYWDVSPIARGQLDWEDCARGKHPELLILDTHLLSNMLWSRTLFGNCPAWIEQALLQRHYDLHLLLDPRGVQWVDDGQRCQPELAARVCFFQACEEWLRRHEQAAVSITGNWNERRDQVMRRLDDWLSGIETSNAISR
jgi:nicotinamide riboside kinase